MNCNITSIFKKFLLIEKSTLQVKHALLRAIVHSSGTQSLSYLSLVHHISTRKIPLTYYSHFSLNKTTFHWKPDIWSRGQRQLKSESNYSRRKGYCTCY